RGVTARRDAHPTRPMGVVGPRARRGPQRAVAGYREQPVPLDDDDIRTFGGGRPVQEGPADGGANPAGKDGGADGVAGRDEGPADGGTNPAGRDGGADGPAVPASSRGLDSGADSGADATARRDRGDAAGSALADEGPADGGARLGQRDGGADGAPVRR